MTYANEVGGNIPQEDSFAQTVPSISIVIPTHNRSNTIKRAVFSVLSQNVDFLELIVVDDCSQDDTLKVLSEIKDPRLRVLKTPIKSGAPAARNLGARSSKGEWIAFQDSDDYWFSFKLERQIECLRRSKDAILCYCKLIQHYGGEVSMIPRSNAQCLEGNIYESLLKDSLVSTQTIIVKRAAFEECGGFREDMPRFQDWELVLRIARFGIFCFVREPLVIAYDTPGNLTSDLMKGVVARKKILELHSQEFEKRPAILQRHYHILGTQYIRLGELSNSLTYLLKSVRLKPWKLASWYWIAITLMRQLISASGVK